MLKEINRVRKRIKNADYYIQKYFPNKTTNPEIVNNSAKQLAKLQHFIKSHWHNKKFQTQELYVLVKKDTESKYGWNYKTNKKWRRITLTDYATIIGYSSSTPAKINCLLKKADANVALYTNLIALYKRFVQLNIKTRMFNDFFLKGKKLTIIKCNMFDLDSSNNTHSINDPPDDELSEWFK